MKIDRDSALTLIIDNQVRLLPAITDSELLLRNTEILIRGLKLLGVPMMITQQYTKGLGMSDPSVYLHTGTMAYMEKRSFSCWREESIRQKIIESGRSQMILCGIESHICVQQTALDLLHEGYQVILVEDCVSSRKLTDKETALKRMMQEGVVLTSYEALLFELMETSLDPHFKELSALVK